MTSKWTCDLCHKRPGELGIYVGKYGHGRYRCAYFCYECARTVHQVVESVLVQEAERWAASD